MSSVFLSSIKKGHVRDQKGPFKDRLFVSHNRFDGLGAVVNMSQLNGVGADEFLANLLALNSINGDPHTPDLERASIVAENDFLTPFDADKPGR